MTKRTRPTPAPSLTPPELDASAAQTPNAPAPAPLEGSGTPPDSTPADNQADTPSTEPQLRPFEEWAGELGVKAWELAAVKTKQRWPASQAVSRQDFKEALKAVRKEVIES